MFERQVCISFSDLSRPIAVQNQSKERKYKENFRVSIGIILRGKEQKRGIADRSNTTLRTL